MREGVRERPLEETGDTGSSSSMSIIIIKSSWDSIDCCFDSCLIGAGDCIGVTGAWTDPRDFNAAETEGLAPDSCFLDAAVAEEELFEVLPIVFEEGAEDKAEERG